MCDQSEFDERIRCGNENSRRRCSKTGYAWQEQSAKMARSTAKAGDSKLQELKYQLELQKIQLMADLERKQWAQAEDEKRRKDAEAERIFRAEQAEKDRQVRIHEVELENKRREHEVEWKIKDRKLN